MVKALDKSDAVQESLIHLDVDDVGVIALNLLKPGKVEELALHLLPEVRSVVVFAHEIYPEVLRHATCGRAMGSPPMSDLMEKNSDFLNSRLTKAAYDVVKVSHKNGFKALPMPAAGCPVDARFAMSIFSYKHAAQAAGLGVIGRSSLLITPSYGPRVRLSCCLTEAVLESNKEMPVDRCNDCNICIKNCPSGALGTAQDAQYKINKFACSAFRNGSGGCYECMRLCPAGK